MRQLLPLLIVVILTFTQCHSEMSMKGKLVDEVNKQVARIDHSHRMSIVEDDFVRGDSLYKIRGYYSQNELLKIVGILKTPHFERDDYFYFKDGKQLFSGHFRNFRDERLAEEYKYYFQNGELARTYMWRDNYTPGKRFPHETFELFEPNLDSLMKTERERMNFFISLLETEGIQISEENENVGANN